MITDKTKVLKSQTALWRERFSTEPWDHSWERVAITQEVFFKTFFVMKIKLKHQQFLNENYAI